MRKDFILFQIFLLCSCWSTNGYQIRSTQFRSRNAFCKPCNFQISNSFFSESKSRTFSHVATLDDAFVPDIAFPNKFVLSLLLGSMVVIAAQKGLQGNSVLSFFKPILKNIFSTTSGGHNTEAASKVLGPSDWGTCSLEKVDAINDNYKSFKFRIAQHNSLPPSGLGVGRKVSKSFFLDYAILIID
jgi:hypothetical protein